MQLKKNETQVRKLCLSLHQWALVCSVMVFVVSAVLTTCAALGKMHSENIWEMLNTDLAEEEEKTHYYYDTNYQSNQNEAKLQVSLRLIIMIIWILYICTYIGCLNLFTATFMIYGVATKSPKYIVPWILISIITYVVTVAIVIATYMDVLPGNYITFKFLVVTLVSTTFFIMLWYIILTFYVHLPIKVVSTRSTTKPTVIQAYNGYTHTINEKKENLN